MENRVTRREFLEKIGRGGLGLYLSTLTVSLTSCTQAEKRTFSSFQEVYRSSSKNLSKNGLELLRYPYLQCPTTSSVKIAWKTKGSCKGEIRYGPTQDLEQMANGLSPTDSHLVTLPDLQPDTQYYYQIFGDGAPLTEMETFKTAKPCSSKSFSFIAFGDSGSGNSDQYRVAEVMKSLNFDLAILTGDIVYPNGDAEYYEPNYFRPYRDLIKKVPFFPSLGNHDLDSGNGKGYLDAFDVPANNPQNSKRYYAFRYAHALLIALDSNEKLLYKPDQIQGSPQYIWLVRELQKAENDPDIHWRFVFFHHPPYSGGYHGQGSQKEWLAQLRKTLIPVLEKYRVDMVFNGHDHHYERSYPIRDGSIADHQDAHTQGITYIVTGGGGRGNNFWRSRLKKGPWCAYMEDTFHVTHVEIDRGLLTLKAMNDRGEIIDKTTIQKSTI